VIVVDVVVISNQTTEANKLTHCLSCLDEGDGVDERLLMERRRDTAVKCGGGV
jgi:hypothetical protein